MTKYGRLMPRLRDVVNTINLHRLDASDLIPVAGIYIWSD